MFEDESQLSEGLFTGSKDAFEAVYLLYNEAIFKFIAKQIGRYDAQDVTQLVFLELIRYKGHIQKIRPFLYRVATRTLTRWLRHRARHEVSMGNQMGNVVDTSKSPAERMNQREQVSALYTQVGALPQDEREAIEASYFDGLSSTDAGEKLAVNAPTVRKRASRGVAKLRLALEPAVSDQRHKRARVRPK
jgi:RNA polymerase sigma-70 factor (ECF subfamily)